MSTMSRLQGAPPRGKGFGLRRQRNAASSSRLMSDIEWRAQDHEQWRVELPIGVTGGPVKHTNPELTTIAVYRGWVGDDACFVGISTRPCTHSSLRAEARGISRPIAGVPPDGAEVEVTGARGARRVDGLMDIEEGSGDPPQ